jgi:hypothetical protein
MRLHGLVGVVFNLFDGFMQDLEHASQGFDLEHRRLDQGRIGGQRLSFLQGLETLLEETAADEIIATAQIYDHAARLRSFEIAADVLKTFVRHEAVGVRSQAAVER